MLDDHRESFCEPHKAPGSALLRSARNARYANKQRLLVDHALAPDPLEDGGVTLPAPVVGRVAEAVARLDRAVREFEEGVALLRGWELDAHLEGWAELKAEHDLRLRFAVGELRFAAKHAVEVLGPALARPPGDVSEEW